MSNLEEHKIPTAALKDLRLSLTAKGLWALACVNPHGKSLSVDNLLLNTMSGRTAMNTALKELMQLGYIIRERKMIERQSRIVWKLVAEPLKRK